MALALVIATVVPAVAAAVVPGSTVEAASSAGGRYVPIAPVRVADSRSNFGTDWRALLGGQETYVDVLPPQVLNQVGASLDEVAAVVVNATLTRTERAGFLTLWPYGQPRPTASNLNVLQPFATVANLATVPIGAGGRIGAYSQSGGELIVDVQGVYVIDSERALAPATPVRGGRLVPLTPTRILDTRELGTPLRPGETATVSFEREGIPADASAVVFNLTVTNTWAPGFFTVWPAGASRPTASNVNVDAAGQTRANQVIARVANRKVSVFGLNGGDVIVDIAGYYTGDSAPVATEGLFHPVGPARVLDTRAGERPEWNTIATANPVAAGAVGADAATASFNVTIVEPGEPGFLAAYPSGGARPGTSTVNASAAGQVVANHATVPLGAGGGVDVFTLAPAHMLLDVFGYFAGTAGSALAEPGAATAAVFTPGPITPPDPPPPGQYAFTYGTDANGVPLERWNPCAPIRVKVNLALATPEQASMLGIAFDRVGSVSGLPFELRGTYSGSRRSGEADDLGADLLVQVVNPDDPVLAQGGSSGEVAGLTDAQSVFDGSRVWFDDVVVSVSNAHPLLATLSIMMHELGHAVGLAHVGSRAEVMYPAATHASPVDWGPGDVQGLTAVGAGAGCR